MKINSLWDCFDRVRGLLDQQTIFDLTAYALFLKKSEIDKIKAFKETYSLDFLSVVYGERVSALELANYIKEVEAEYGIEDGILSEDFLNIASRITDAGKVKKIFDTIYNLKIDSKEVLMNLYDRFMDQYLVGGGRMSGECGTSRSLAKLEAVLLNADDGAEIYDGYCGFGSSIVEAGNSTNRYYIRDINRYALAKAIITLIIHDRQIISAICGDTNIEDERRFEYAISEPPFGYRKDYDYISKNPHPENVISNTSLEIERIIESLNSNGRAVILIPAGILFSGKTIDFRRFLVGQYLSDHNILEAVIGLPAGLIPGTTVSTMLLVIDKKHSYEKILMVNSEDIWKSNKGREQFLTQEGLETIKDIVLSGKVIEKLSTLVTVDDIVDKDMNMSPNIYVNPYKIEEVKIADVKKLYEQEKILQQELNELNKALAEIREEN